MIVPSTRAGAPSSDGTRIWPDVRTLLAELLAGHPGVWRSLVLLVDPLDRHDRTHHTEFLRTLEAYLESDLSTGAAAEKLGVHRHTVAYRLKQIERVLGHPIRGGEDRLAVELAVRARRLRV